MGGGMEAHGLWVRQGLESEWRPATVALLHGELQVLSVEFRDDDSSTLELEISSEHFVGDSERCGREHAFLVSDLAQALYVACSDASAKREWMQAIAGCVHKLIKASESQPQQPQQPQEEGTSNGKPRVEKALSVAAVRAMRLSVQLRASLALLEVATRVRKSAEARASSARATELSEGEQAAKRADKARAAAKAEADKAEAVRRAAEQRRVRAEQAAAADKRRAERRQREEQEAQRLIAQKRDQTKRRSLRVKGGTVEPGPGGGGGGGILSRIQGWNKKADAFQAGQAENVFSGSRDAGCAPAPLRPGDAGYGMAKAGSKTAERHEQAKAWVEKEVAKFLSVLKDVGAPGADGRFSTTFGSLFLAYESISDSLVGIMMRAKKRKLIEYDGDMLFQGVHNDVVVTIL